ncbi:MAG: hypothetical protein HY235_25755 [Acidobacteria bacterium]|nr:hypothetical protein [Acidobacteriota bacterium]
MKTIQMPKELQPFLKFAESLALSTNPQFLRIIETARNEIREGRTISLEALERKFGISPPNKALHRTRQKTARR